MRALTGCFPSQRQRIQLVLPIARGFAASSRRRICAIGALFRLRSVKSRMADDYAVIEAFANAVLEYQRPKLTAVAFQAFGEAGGEPHSFGASRTALPAQQSTKLGAGSSPGQVAPATGARLEATAEAEVHEALDDDEGEQTALEIAPEWDAHFREAHTRRQLQARARQMRREAYCGTAPETGASSLGSGVAASPRAAAPAKQAAFESAACPLTDDG